MRLDADVGDLNTRARIRNAAIEVFGAQGFGVGVRTIAAAAGVSAGMVNHHFGSKDGLRAACDEWVAEFFRAKNAEALTGEPITGILTALAEIDDHVPAVGYALRSFQVGGAFAESLLEKLIADTENTLQAGVEAGTIKPSRNPAARARYMTLCHIGATVLHLQLRHNGRGDATIRADLRELTDFTTFPALELYAQGLFTDSSIIDDISKEL